MMNNVALKRWLVLGSLLALTLYLAWNSPQPEMRPASVLVPNHGAGTTARLTSENQASENQISGIWASASQPAPAERDFRFAPRAQAVEEVVDIFAPAVVEQPRVDFKPVVRQAAPPAPQAPPLPFAFVGKISEADGAKIFLQADNVLYTLKVGDIFAQQYQLVRVENGKLSLLYLPLNITQTMFYGEAP